jgi:hypothetical protein
MKGSFMKVAAVYSKYVTQTYYGHPVDHLTVTVTVSDELLPEEIAIVKENARRHMEQIPVESFPVAGAHGSLLSEYFERHPKLAHLSAAPANNSKK